jgi:hypothetical protein
MGLSNPSHLHRHVKLVATIYSTGEENKIASHEHRALYQTTNYSVHQYFNTVDWTELWRKNFLQQPSG